MWTDIPDKWRKVLAAGRSDYHILVTVAFGRSIITDAVRRDIPLASLPGSVCVATAGVSVTYEGRKFFFAPALGSWPEISYSIDPILRTADTSSVSLTLTTDADFPFAQIDPGGVSSTAVEMRLWMEGMTLGEAPLLFLGYATSAQFSSQLEGIEIQAVDGDPNREVSFPPGELTLSRGAFPDIPTNVSGVFNRQVIIGKFDYPILCPLVDGVNRNLFYVADHYPLTSNPIGLQINGVESTMGRRFIPFRLPPGETTALDNDTVITLMALDEPVSDETTFVTVSNGAGLPAWKNPVITLLEDYGGYAVADEAKTLLGLTNVDLSVFINASGNVLNIVKERLLPQTKFVLYFGGGKARVYSIDGIESSFRMGVGTGLRGRVVEAVSETPLDGVVNALEIGYQRNIFATNEIDVSRQVYILDSSRAVGALKSTLQQSERLYGRRFVHMDFADIAVTTAAVPEIIPTFAESFLSLNALQHRMYHYMADLWPGLIIPLNMKLYIDDDDEDIANKKVRLVQKTLNSNGLILTFMSENT